MALEGKESNLTDITLSSNSNHGTDQDEHGHTPTTVQNQIRKDPDLVKAEDSHQKLKRLEESLDKDGDNEALARLSQIPHLPHARQLNTKNISKIKQSFGDKSGLQHTSGHRPTS